MLPSCLSNTVTQEECQQLRLSSCLFTAGNIKHCLVEWQKITSDPNILQIVKGCEIVFEDLPPAQPSPPPPIIFTQNEFGCYSEVISTLLQKKVVEPCEPCPGQFISNVFFRPKKDGSYRMILNLKHLNYSVEYHKFKMDTFQSVVHLVEPRCFMASVDIQDAYFSVSVSPLYRKYLRFIWAGKLYQFTALPNGLSSAPRIFTKLMKPVLSTLRLQGHIVCAYLDDLYIQNADKDSCLASLQATTELLERLGFIVHPRKVSLPSQSISTLGFLIDSVSMRVFLTEEKVCKTKLLVNGLLKAEQATIRDVAGVIGKIVSNFPGVQFGQLHYRGLEVEKAKALTLSRGNFEDKMSITSSMKTDMQWWLMALGHTFKPIDTGKPEVVLSTDASLDGWGAALEGGVSTGGRFSATELQMYGSNINALELMAIFLSLEAFLPHLSNKHVLIKSDNTTAIAYVREMGGVKSQLCNQLAQKIWDLCINHAMWLTITHLPGVLNVVADAKSRKFNDRTEWMLDKELAKAIFTVFGTPSLDLFASRINKQVENFVSWQPEPGAAAVDAFSVIWSADTLYCFPPFSLIGRCLQKLQLDGGSAILIAPLWPTQAWFSKIPAMLEDFPVLVHLKKHSLVLPHQPKLVHPLHPLTLLACKLSGNHLRTGVFQQELLKQCLQVGVQEAKNSMLYISKSGTHFVWKGVVIPYKRI